MNKHLVRQACIELGYEEPISVEPDGTVWLGLEDNKTYPDMDVIRAKYDELVAARETSKQELLVRLGITEAEAKLLLS